MSELDHLKEEVAYPKFWLGIVVVTDIGLAGWLISSSGTAALYTVFFAVVGLVLLSAGIVFLHRRIERRITRISRRTRGEHCTLVSWPQPRTRNLHLRRTRPRGFPVQRLGNGVVVNPIRDF